jgi:pimeloyl-ACP methyl ester carboxylesterase
MSARLRSPSSSSSFVSVCGRQIEYQFFPAAAAGPTLVFLHEGLGSIGQWRDFPARIVAATGLPAMVYARYGYGQSDVQAEPRQPDFMHREALDALPGLLRRLGIARPILIGHSDGASIALIYAGSGQPAAGLAVMAPHVFIEDKNIQAIAAIRNTFETTDLAQKLARYHRDPAKTFIGWSDVWLSPGFRNWNIESYLAGIKCPLLAIQGYGDEYGSMQQVDSVARQTGGPAEVLKLEDCGHSPHKDQPEKVTQSIAEFARRCSARQREPDP